MLRSTATRSPTYVHWWRELYIKSLCRDQLKSTTTHLPPPHSLQLLFILVPSKPNLITDQSTNNSKDAVPRYYHSCQDIAVAEAKIVKSVNTQGARNDNSQGHQ
jgi:hypothetical protein